VTERVGGKLRSNKYSSKLCMQFGVLEMIRKDYDVSELRSENTCGI